VSGKHAFDVVIFDYDGTLVDTRVAIARCLELSFAKHGRALPPPEDVAPVVNRGLALDETCLLLDQGLRERHDAVESIVRSYRAMYASEGEPWVRLFPAVRETLQEIHVGGIKCLVVSNKGIDAIRRSLDRYDLSPFIDRVFGDEPGLPHKPDPALLTQYIRPKLPQVATERMLMVGDTEVDIQFARNAGIACCWAAYGFGDPERCRALKPDYEIAGIAELPARILR
jgi:phosphoglycolate phosphatase